MLPEVKVLRDPIHGYIHVEEEIIWDLLAAPEVQRLRRIRQLGGDFVVYHTAEHSRFSHSLGVYEICRRIFREVPGMKESLSAFEQTAGLCAALLHDIGHGPFSHAYERISHISHEEISCRILLDKRTRVHQILADYDPALPQAVADILMHQARPLLCDLISSQLDCDRMDYLLRDAYETGTSYGSFDLERILRTLRVKDGRLCVKKSGMHSIEDYIMSRYQMYWQVYLHPDAAGYEYLLEAFFRRYQAVREMEKVDLLEPVFDDPFDLMRFLHLDDNIMLAGIAQAVSHRDPILSDLADRLINRRLLDWRDVQSLEQIESIAKQTEQAGYDPDYYFHIHSIGLNMYLPYKEEENNAIYIGQNEALCPLSACSVVAASLLNMKRNDAKWVYFPKDVDNGRLDCNALSL